MRVFREMNAEYETMIVAMRDVYIPWETQLSAINGY